MSSRTHGAVVDTRESLNLMGFGEYGYAHDKMERQESNWLLRIYVSARVKERMAGVL